METCTQEETPVLWQINIKQIIGKSCKWQLVRQSRCKLQIISCTRKSAKQNRLHENHVRERPKHNPVRQAI